VSVSSKLTSGNFAVQFLFVSALFLAGIARTYVQDSRFSAVFIGMDADLFICVEGRIGRRELCSSANCTAGFWELREWIETRRHPEEAASLFKNAGYTGANLHYSCGAMALS